MSADDVGVGVIGAGFVADLHLTAFHEVGDARVVAIAAPSERRLALARQHGIAETYASYHDLLARPDVDVVTLAMPNDLHARICIDAARSGKHVICEKPLAMTLKQADAMIEACRENGVLLMYAEQLCFAPKYVRAKTLVDEGAIGRLFLMKQSEKHFGPHSPWFWDVERSGGGVVLDMGCHAFQFFRWVAGDRRVASVQATMATLVHADKTAGEDHAFVILTFDDGTLAQCETSWAKRGGMDDRAELYGSDGLVVADLLMGSSLLTYSERGYGYAVEKATLTSGWSFAMFEEAWNYGFPQEMAHFIDSVRSGRKPLVTGEDGRAVLEIVYTAYASAGQQRVIYLPFDADVAKPIDLWRSGA
jgi:myo-inositol 2-dehydrogenase / D-chiro-inositol 1-dehydrogenase